MEEDKERGGRKKIEKEEKERRDRWERRGWGKKQERHGEK
jgi:hypothetical protein